MGDRGNIFFVDSQLSEGRWGGLYLYSHWGGSGMIELAQQALTRGRSRWGDSQYLARVVFSEMVAADVEGLTSFGLSTVIGDNEHPIVRINDLDGTVALCEPRTEADPSVLPLRTWTYAEFVEAREFSIPSHRLYTREQVLAAAREVLGSRPIEVVVEADTAIVKIYLVTTIVERAMSPGEVEVAALGQKGIEAEAGDELLFPFYYLAEEQALAEQQNTSMARLLGYPINAWASMQRALERAASR